MDLNHPPGTLEAHAQALRPRQSRLLDVDVSLVLFEPDEALLARLIESLAESGAGRLRKHLFIHVNGGDDRLPQLARGHGFENVSIERSARNLGFGRGHNANAARGSSPYFMVLNQDCVLELGVLEALLERAQASADDVAAWELRQLPYEHPKAYDPATLETRWVSGAATLFRRRAFDEVRGFDPRIFLYAEDVDLSWRLRERGWRLLYQPRLAVTHLTYRHPGEAKPRQVIEGTLSNLCLRARHGGTREVLRGLRLLAREIVRRDEFPGRRLGLLGAAVRFLFQWPHFARTRCSAAASLGHRFIGWDFESHREGAFHPMAPAADRRTQRQPLVSILIRTVGRPVLLRQALACCANQTYDNLEVVVVEDGPAQSRDVVAEFAQRLPITYRATGERVGRARAGNVALAAARGEWLNFLDDDDALFADHVEVLVDAVQRAGTAGAYALAWEARTRLGEEVSVNTRHRQPFDRMVLWQHNYLPIQSVLFHRRLYQRHGGFAEDMEQLEDWNLWTRYTLEDDFVLVAKTTSKYRVPDDAREEAARRARLDRAYRDAAARQEQMRARLSPVEIARMAAAFARQRRLLARIERRLPLAGRLLRRWTALE